MGFLKRSGQYLRTHQRAVLVALLAVLHVTLLAGPRVCSQSIERSNAI